MKRIIDHSHIDFWNQFILDGNLDALSQVYFNYYDQLLTYGLNHTSEKQVVEDTIQDVFMNLIKHRKRIGDVQNLSGYLISSFRRQLFHYLNRQKKTVLLEQIQIEQFDYFKIQDEDILEKENLERIHITVKQCIGNLTAKQQEIIYLRFESGISYEEISEMLQITVDSCYKSVYRSIKTIRSEVEKILCKGGNVILWFWFRLYH